MTNREQQIRDQLRTLANQDIERTPDGWALYDLADGEVHGTHTLDELAEYVRQIKAG